jgi:hypothetical protein
MKIRSFAVAAVAALALAACNKPADDTVKVDSAAPANATPTVVPTDSVAKTDSAAPTTTTDSAKPTADTGAAKK